MIQLLATRYNKLIASLLLLIFECSFVSVNSNPAKKDYSINSSSLKDEKNRNKKEAPAPSPDIKNTQNKSDKKPARVSDGKKGFIGGPNQPEMSSFKSVGTDNMVNLFTGDFSYNIPLLDVGGYPVNIFYDGGISMEQEASWVGLGWNINPGTVSRNMRGVPDDFNGTDELIQTQTMKPNNTFGFSVGYDLELVGVKGLENIVSGSVGGTLGLSFNNYLGPAFEMGVKSTTNVKIAGKGGTEKSFASLSVGGGIGANVSSRSGLTVSPSISLSASAFQNSNNGAFGLSSRLGTSYNSRSGIKELQLSEQMSFNYSVSSSSSISFSKPSYIPALRMLVSNEAHSGRFQLGNALFGVYGSGEVEVYRQRSEVKSADVLQKKPLVGYLYYQKAANNANAVMDFTRFNDNEVMPVTPVISAPQYAYDVFSVQGEGTGGTIRAYRNDMGYVRDNKTTSKDKSISAGADVGVPGHYGANFSIIKTPTVISEWFKGNKLKNTIGFKEAQGNTENVYFRNPGETGVLHNDQYKNIGGTDLVRFKLGGSGANPTIEPALEQFSKLNAVIGTTTDIITQPAERKKRTQVTSFLTAEEAAGIGLDKRIKTYNSSNVLSVENKLLYDSLERFYTSDPVGDAFRKKHHISQINVTEAGGRRYVYGLPVYNKVQKDFSFSVSGTPTPEDQISFAAGNETEHSLLLKEKTVDGFVQITETPAYAHSFLLTGLLSPDYVDVNGNGITEDDLGDAVKFNYTKFSDHQWRTPLSTQPNMANFNDGHRSETKDDKALVSYGKREAWYMHSIESKTMIALFTVEDRKDGKGVSGEQSGVNVNDNSQKRLQKIDLYSKSDLKKNGLSGNNRAKPIKTVWFTYSYTLCANSPSNNNQSETANEVNVNSSKGKLTLDGIFFTFNGKSRTSKNKYVFSYGNGSTDNPAYTLNAADRWGTYKPASQNPGSIKNGDFPFAIQDKTTANENAKAWSLKKILLPSGGQIEVEYESDDYAFVQNKRAAAMMQLEGLGSSPAAFSEKLFGFNGLTVTENDHVFIKVPQPCANKAEVLSKYLEGVEQLTFKLLVNMPKKPEYINSYATIADYGVYDANRIWIRLNKRDNLSPLTLTALDYLRERLPGQAFPGYDVSESTGLKQVGDILLGMMVALGGAFKDPVLYLRDMGKVNSIVSAKSFVRLNDPDGYKYGGGQRVKSVVLKDNWQAMTQQFTSSYGQRYDYSTSEIINGVERPISSGVASYEPSIGNEENPFQSIVEVSTKLPLGPANYGAIEMPMLDAFFPAAMVGYSKVTVRSLVSGTIPAGKKSRSGIGKQVTEFFTAKDFPVYYNYTPFDPSSDKQDHQKPKLNFFYKYSADRRALSQGFIVETNDMHGKIKSQASYAEGDEKTRINYTENFYRNTGSKGLAEKFDFIHAPKGGEIEEGNMGIDVELMTDTREFSVKSSSFEVQGQLDLFPIFAGLPWLAFIWPVSGNSDNTYRAVTTTKVISYHSIVDRVVVIDKGSMVTTKNLVYDAETGDVVVSQTQNEFDKPIYNVNYPAYWACSGMGLAYKNIDAIYSGLTFSDGKIIAGMTADKIKANFESGDEIYIIDPGGTAGCAPAMVSPIETRLIWAMDKNKNTTSLTNITPDFIFIEANGKPYTRSGVQCRIVRSGKRNMLSAPVAAITLMTDPVNPITHKLSFNANSKIINASAVEYMEKWQTDKDVIGKYKTETDPVTCEITEVPYCLGYLEKRINPYRKGLLGNFRQSRNLVYYGDRSETNPVAATNLVENGFLNNFTTFWNFNSAYNLVPDLFNPKWVGNTMNTRLNARGLELETKDALNIYTSAQYGYNKTLPVAISNNARYNEMFAEGFEDAGYNETLNGAPLNNCLDKHINFGNIYNADDIGVNAHTGKFVLGVNSQTPYQLAIPVVNSVEENFDLNFGTDVIRGPLHDEGVNIDNILASPDPLQPGQVITNKQLVEQNATYVVNGHAGMSYMFTKYDFDYCSPANPVQIIQGESGVKGNQYMEIKQCGNYQIDFSLMTSNNSSGATLIKTEQAFKLTIRDLEGNQVTSYQFMEDAFQISKVWSTYLDKGVFLFSWESTTNLRYEQPYTSCNTNGIYSNEGRNVWASFAIHWPTGQSTPSGYIAPRTYKTLSTLSECNITKPIAATSAMINPVFTIPSGKKMLFSAWVKQNCGTNACTNKVEIDYGNGTMSAPLTSSGPVIEGWQRIEGYFTAPEGITTATLKFVNNSGSTIYFDDIRIHPFNANMKSYVYDPINLRLVAELDANNYASFYEYDEEGTLIRTKAETKQGIKTITETRSFKQAAINQLQ